jgi:lipopolysaccharide export LptBFGC system permease protein LptF
MCVVLAVVMSLMTLEHLPRLLEITRFSAHRGYIISHTVAGLLPEYGGIGLLAGLFLGIALTVRRLALRGELDVIEACGVAPLRWMRLPLAVAATVGIATIANQGWLMPAGEIRLAEIGERMADGEFGHQLPAGQFIDLGSQDVLMFEHVDTTSGEIGGLFLRTNETTYTARRGRFWQLASGAMAIELRDGRAIQRQAAGVLDFTYFYFRVDGGKQRQETQAQADLVRRANIGRLLALHTTYGRSAAYGRCLWAALALLIPLMALILGKPARRQSGAFGILVGMIALVLGLKMTTPLIDGSTSEPELLAASILMTWSLFAYGLIWAEKVFGQGFVDLWARLLVQNLRRSNV